MSDATSTENEAVPGEGWYPDPEDVTARWLRHWDGTDWSPIPPKLASRSERERQYWPGEDPEAAARLNERDKQVPMPILIAYMLFAMSYLAHSLIAGGDAKQIIAAALPVLIGVLSWAVHRPRAESP